jgi:hypothetical protein
MRARAHQLGTVKAPDQKAAEAEAVRAFGLSEHQRKRLIFGSTAFDRTPVTQIGFQVGERLGRARKRRLVRYAVAIATAQRVKAGKLLPCRSRRRGRKRPGGRPRGPQFLSQGNCTCTPMCVRLRTRSGATCVGAKPTRP